MPEERRQSTASKESIVKALLFSLALAMGLVLWGGQPQVGVDNLMAASRLAGEQVYNIFR